MPNDPTEKTYYLVFGPLGTTLEAMVRAIGERLAYWGGVREWEGHRFGPLRSTEFCRLVPPYDTGTARFGNVDGRLCKGATLFWGKGVQPDSLGCHSTDRAWSPPPAWSAPLSSFSQCSSRASLVMVASMPPSQSQRLSCQTSPQLQLAVRHASSAENTYRRRDSRRSTLRSRQSRSGTPGSW